MGVTQERTERFQGRVESQAVAGAHESVKEPVSTMLCRRTQQLRGESEHGGKAFGGRTGRCGRKKET